jgi:hypothetical protein
VPWFVVYHNYHRPEGSPHLGIGPYYPGQLINKGQELIWLPVVDLKMVVVMIKRKLGVKVGELGFSTDVWSLRPWSNGYIGLLV